MAGFVFLVLSDFCVIFLDFVGFVSVFHALALGEHGLVVHVCLAGAKSVFSLAGKGCRG